MNKTNTYKESFNSALKRAEKAWSTLGDKADDDLICTYNDLERAKENDYKTQIRKLTLLDEQIDFYKQIVRDREQEKKAYLERYEVK